ncbi:MAG: HAD family hydrolase [Chloroflexota bacterium]
MPITTILFDLDDTLLIEHVSVDRALQAAASLASSRLAVDPEIVIKRARQCAEVLWQASPTHVICQELGVSAMEGLCSAAPGEHADLTPLKAWLGEYQHAVWRDVLQTLACDDDTFAAELAGAYRDHRRQHHVIVPDAGAVLSQLKQSYRLGLVTNGPADLQSDKLERTKLGRYFDAVAISGQLRTGKPDPGIFSIILDQLGSSPAESLMVGDNPLRDVLGALKAGIQPVWLNPMGALLPIHAGLSSVPEIRSITELRDLIQRLDRSGDLPILLQGTER